MLIMADFIAPRNAQSTRATKGERERGKTVGERELGVPARNVIKDNANELKLNGKKKCSNAVAFPLTFPRLFPAHCRCCCCRQRLSVCLSLSLSVSACQLTLHVARCPFATWQLPV